MKLCKVIKRHLLSYGSEVWTVEKSNRRMHEAAETLFSRAVPRVKLRDKDSCEYIRKGLQKDNITDRIWGYRNK
jgi:hypothetical protein